MATIDAIYKHLEGASVAALEGELKDKEIGFVRGAAQGDVRINDSGTGFLQFAFREKENTFGKTILTGNLQLDATAAFNMSSGSGEIVLKSLLTNNLVLDTLDSSASVISEIAGVKISEVKTTGVHLPDNKKLFLGTGNDGELFSDGTDTKLDSPSEKLTASAAKELTLLSDLQDVIIEAATSSKKIDAKINAVSIHQTTSAGLAMQASTLLTVAASAAGGAGLNLAHGAAPTSPNNGDIWSTSGGMFFYVAAYNFGLHITSGSPEGTVTAVPGNLCVDTTGGAGTTLYVKESGTGNTGWIAK